MLSDKTPSRTQLWLGLTRPRTLLSGLSSVLVAIFYAASIGAINPLRTALLLIVAVSAQIGSNIANDLIDFKKGADTDERTGPLRPLSKGLLTEGEVRRALYISLAVLLASGIALVALSSWWLLLVGVAVALGACCDELLHPARDDRRPCGVALSYGHWSGEREYPHRK